jgi:hypothetical protein
MFPRCSSIAIFEILLTTKATLKVFVETILPLITVTLARCVRLSLDSSKLFLLLRQVESASVSHMEPDIPLHVHIALPPKVPFPSTHRPMVSLHDETSHGNPVHLPAQSFRMT